MDQEYFETKGASHPIEQSGPWGPWISIFFTILTIGFVSIIQLLVACGVFLLYSATDPQLRFDTFIGEMAADGLILTLSLIAGGTVTIGFILLLAWQRGNYSISDYLALHKISRLIVVRWFGFFLIFVGLCEVITFLLGQQIVPEFWIKQFVTAQLPLLFYTAVIVIGPLSEEVLFPGFLFRGLEKSRLGPVWAAVITSLGWTVLHFYYDAFHLGQVLVIGLFLGYARLRTSSLAIPIMIHVMNNLISTIEIAVVVHMG